MLVELELTNFKAARHRKVIFGPGLCLILGPNECGKSTLIDAVLYALYGSRALSQPLSEIVTLGEKETSLKVRATFLIEGRRVLFTRSKAGAEVYLDGAKEPFVTGQNEVSAYATGMMRADREMAVRLMMASQRDLRGALEGGPSETAGMMEKLANFDLFDDLLGRISSEMPTGSDAMVRRDIAEIDEALASGEPVAPDVSALDEMGKAAADALALAEGALVEIEREVSDIKAEIAAAESVKARHIQAVKVVADAQHRCSMIEAELFKAAGAASQPDLGDEIQKQLELIEGARVAVALAGVYRRFQALPSLEDEWEGDVASLDAEISTAIQARNSLVAETADVKVALAHAVASLKANHTCPTCKQALPEAPSEEEMADRRQYKAELEHDLLRLQTAYRESDNYLEVLGGLKTANATVMAFLADQDTNNLVTVDYGYVPARVTWAGQVPGKAEDIKQLEAKLRELGAREQARISAIERVSGLKVQQAEAGDRLKEAEATLASTPNPVEPEQAKARLQELQKSVHDVKSTIDTNRRRIAEIQRQIDSAEHDYQVRVSAYKSAQERRTVLLARIDEMAFANNLVKKVKSARPVVADRLWARVLGSVSAMFSSMRGETTVVTKDSSGFKANGLPVAGLSGSTLDALGLAIRVGLIRTFMPGCQMLTLDEPFSAADTERTEAMLSFIKAAGFPQTILITHETASRTVADEIITLEG